MAPARVLDRDRAALVRGARILGLPVVVTEQYPKGLGSTVPELADHLDGIEPIAKVSFSAEEFKRVQEPVK